MGSHSTEADLLVDRLRALDSLPASPKRFPDGAQYRIEIPSTEGPDCLEVVLSESAALDVPVHRVSQGSGSLLLTSAELRRFRDIAADAGVEVSLFARPGADWVPSASARSPAGGVLGNVCHGSKGIIQGMMDIHRAASHGFRSVLIADIGLLSIFTAERKCGALPQDMQAKISVMLPITNPATARVLVDLGANTLNVMTDLSLADLAAIRREVDVPLDVYVEAPDSLGGFVRLYEIADIIRVASPVYVKFGLANASGLYPTGSHLGSLAVQQSRERVRRARIGLELLSESGYRPKISALGCEDLAIPSADPATDSISRT